MELRELASRGLALITLTVFVTVLAACQGADPPATPADSTAGFDPGWEETIGDLPAASDSWPSFRGVRASGLGRGSPPVQWDLETGANVAWRRPIPGLGHSSPVIWGNRVYVTSAVSDNAEPYLRVGLYGSSPDHPEEIVHHFRLYCLDQRTGEVLWERTAHSGIPKVKRHIKSSHANSTPATDGTHVVAFFGSEGLYCYDTDGELLWIKDLGLLDAGALDMPELQWGFGSSPIIHDDKVVVLCDVNNQSFIAAFDVTSGDERWRTLRDEVPTWGTPTAVEVDGRIQLLVNGYQHIGAYDAETGEEIWRMRGGGDIPVPTPVVAHGLIFITNSHGRMRPIYAISLAAQGDISLADGETSNEHVKWSDPRRGAYMPTPIVIGDELYILGDNGVLTCYDAASGEQLYRERAGSQRGAYSASPVAAGGRLYLPSEHGRIHVVKAGAEYALLASNEMGEECLATPAVAADTLFVRTSRHLVAIRANGATHAAEAGPQEAPTANDPAAATSEPLPQGDLTDPVKILRWTDSLTAAVNAVRYDVVLVGSEAAAPQVGRVEASVIAEGLFAGMPSRFRIDARITPPGAPQPIHVTAGSDGNRYYLIDHASKTVHRDFEAGVIGAFGRPLQEAFMREFHAEDPFGAEIGGKGHELREPLMIGDEECYAVYLDYDVEQKAEVVWYIGKRDLLPRGRHDYFEMGDGQLGGLRKMLSNLEADPELAADAFELVVPEGYTVTDQPAG